MGYTHYWFDRPKTIRNYSSICEDIDKISEYSARHGIVLLGWDREKQEYTADAPLYDKHMIAISAPEDEVCETFCMDKVIDPDEHMMFCKTARLPYDLTVCLILLRMRATTPNFNFNSDGDLDSEPEWIAARKAYAEIFPTHSAS